MRKLALALIAATVISSTAFAQFGKITYGIRIGGGLATQAFNNPGVTSTDYIRVFNAGVVAEVPLINEFYLKPYLNVANKGGTIFEDALTTTNKITYFNLTLDAVHKYNARGLGKLVFGIGPYVSRGWRGHIDYETPSSDNQDRIAFGNNNDFKRFDAGLNAMAGLELGNRLTFTLAYDFGLTNIASETLKEVGYKSVYNRAITINLGFMFK